MENNVMITEFVLSVEGAENKPATEQMLEDYKVTIVNVTEGGEFTYYQCRGSREALEDIQDKVWDSDIYQISADVIVE